MKYFLLVIALPTTHFSWKGTYAAGSIKRTSIHSLYKISHAMLSQSLSQFLVTAMIVQLDNSLHQCIIYIEAMATIIILQADSMFSLHYLKRKSMDNFMSTRAVSFGSLFIHFLQGLPLGWLVTNDCKIIFQTISFLFWT